MIFFPIILFIYGVTILLLAMGISKIKFHPVLENFEFPESGRKKVSVVVVFRNEKQNISKLIRELKSQSADPTLFDIYLYDDESSDGSYGIAEREINGSERFHLMKLPKIKGSKKKWAISDASERSRCDFMLLTDADCSLSPFWIFSYLEILRTQSPNMVGGIVLRKGRGIRGKWENIESLVLAGITALGLKKKVPIMVNGGNLMISSEVLNSGPFEGKEGVPSGDDMNLMEKAIQKGKNSILLNSNLGSLVVTEEDNSLSKFINQKIRWAGKWRFTGSGKAKIPVLGFIIFQLTFVLGIFWFLTQGKWDPFIWNFLWFKAFSEIFFCLVVANKFRFQISMGGLLLFEILFPFYFLLFGSLSRFLSYKWKGRRIVDHG